MEKVFACVYDAGVGIKVPEDLAKNLINKEEITCFQPMASILPSPYHSTPNNLDVLRDYAKHLI